MMLHEPITLQAGMRTVGHFQRKDESCNRTLVIYRVLFIYSMAKCNTKLLDANGFLLHFGHF